MFILAIFSLFLFVFFLIVFFRKRSLLSLFCSLFFLSTSAVCIGLSAIGNLTEERAVLKVCLTGEQRNSPMEWKNPSGTLQNSIVGCHEVIFRTTDGAEVGHFFIPGELCAVRAKIFRFHPLLGMLGVKSKYRFDLVYSGYRDAEKYKTRPIEAFAFSYPLSSWNASLFKTWESFFFQRTTFLGTSAALESNYFPLTDENDRPLSSEYSLLISSTGLSIKSIPKI